MHIIIWESRGHHHSTSLLTNTRSESINMSFLNTLTSYLPHHEGALPQWLLFVSTPDPSLLQTINHPRSIVRWTTCWSPQDIRNLSLQHCSMLLHPSIQLPNLQLRPWIQDPLQRNLSFLSPNHIRHAPLVSHIRNMDSHHCDCSSSDCILYH